jgi:hypothetical protein
MITNREEANKYYNLVNELVDEYIDKWKIRPSRLKNYLKPGSKRFDRFLIKHNLSEVKGVDKVLKDVIEDRSSMESDGVIKFESFFLFESNDYKISSMKECLYKGIEKADIKMEKILANYFDTNLGSIDIKDSDKHIFRLENWEGDDKNVIIYSIDDLKLIQININDYLYNELSKREIELTDKIKIKLDLLINENSFEEKIKDILSEKKLVEIISDLLGDYKFDGDSNNHYIWIKKD